MGKRKVPNEANLRELVLPSEGEFLGRAAKLSGGDHLLVRCTDG